MSEHRPCGRVGRHRRSSISRAIGRRRVPVGRSGWCDPVGARRLSERARGPSLGWHRCDSPSTCRNVERPQNRRLIRQRWRRRLVQRLC
jgi:hypothetical protein